MTERTFFAAGLEQPAPPPTRLAPTSLLGWVVGRLAWRLRSLPLQIQVWNGACLAPRFEPALATLVVRRRRTLLRMILDPLLGFAEAYRAGEVEVSGNLVEALAAVFKRLKPSPPRTAEPARRRFWTLWRAEQCARHHYDRGNDFFRLWLDDQMVYTCAYFSSPAMTLEEAQIEKMDHVCRKLRLKAGERVLEAGCGWGALARHMALHYGVEVTACNVSREQIRYARERTAAQGLDDRITFIEDDFRNLRGSYDVFVSLGMLEHVGQRHYGSLGQVIHDRLDPLHGRGLLHFIGRNSPERLNSWIRKRIFPNAHAPALSEVFERVLEPWDFSVLDVENLRRHYVETLAHWLQRFESSASASEAMFDEAFVRGWRLYLSGSQAAFTAGSLQLFQVVFARGCDNDVPLTRASIYASRLDRAS